MEERPQTSKKEVSIPSLSFPFHGSFPTSFLFGAKPADENVRIRYKQWKLKGHNGVDFMLPEGTEVLAVGNGKIIQCGQNGEYGLCVTISHRWGISLYAHLKETCVQNNQQIKRGECIGYSGNSGLTSGPHLHFGIKPLHADESNGYLGYIDPAPFLKKSSKKKKS